MLKKDVDPNEVVESKPDQDDQPVAGKHRHRLNRFTPAQLQQLTSGITHQVTQQVTHVTQQVTQHVTDFGALFRLGVRLLVSQHNTLT